MADQARVPWLIEFNIPGSSSVVKLRIEGNSVIGRADQHQAGTPDLDLSPWGAMELGVAPRHVIIMPEADEVKVADLGSGKPTLVNGRRLSSRSYALAPGDDLQLGVLHLRVASLTSAAGDSAPRRAATPDAVQDNPTPGRGQSILVVEDEPESAEIFRLILEKAGFKAQVCREVVSAIRALNNEMPSAIVLDLMLPDIHGLELCRYVRRDMQEAAVPIIVVSAAAKQATIAQALEIGANVFLGKPFGMRDLVRVVASLVDWYEAGDAAPGQTKQLADAPPIGLSAMPKDMQRDAVVFFVAGYDEPIAVVVQSRITIGRRSGSTSRRPHVDLERYGAFEAGVSRIHAALYREADGFFVEDLESSNGTFIQGEQLEPGRRYPVMNATELVLGTLPVRVFFFTDDDAGLMPGGNKGRT